MNTIFYSNELYHHGILGQKWGVRRYQNVDGSYTNAGKKRYSSKETYKAISNIHKNGTDEVDKAVSSRLKSSQLEKAKQLAKNLKKAELTSEEEFEAMIPVYDDPSYKIPKKLQKKLDNYDKAFSEYYDYCSDLGEKLIGDYGKMKYKTGEKWGSRDVEKFASNAVREAIERLSEKE